MALPGLIIFLHMKENTDSKPLLLAAITPMGKALGVNPKKLFAAGVLKAAQACTHNDLAALVMMLEQGVSAFVFPLDHFNDVEGWELLHG